MKEITVTKLHNLSQLHDELVAALPSLAPVGEGAAKQPVMRVEGAGNVITLYVPDDADEVAIGNVIAAHVYTPPQPQPNFRLLAQNFRSAVNNATTVAALKLALNQELMLLLRAMAQKDVKDL